MPIPSRKGNESEDSFIGRCMAAIGNEYPQDQALAICYDAFKGEKKTTKMKTTEQKILSKLNVINGRQLGRYKGINLTEDGSVNLEEPCWDGYEQYGTKILDGREVPNCIPIE